LTDAFWPKSQLAEHPLTERSFNTLFDRTPLDRKVISSKGHLPKQNFSKRSFDQFYFLKMSFDRNKGGRGSFDRSVILPKWHFTERSFERKLFGKGVIWFEKVIFSFSLFIKKCILVCLSNFFRHRQAPCKRKRVLNTLLFC
jgi:hypothetical protein